MQKTIKKMKNMDTRTSDKHNDKRKTKKKTHKKDAIQSSLTKKYQHMSIFQRC